MKSNLTVRHSGISTSRDNFRHKWLQVSESTATVCAWASMLSFPSPVVVFTRRTPFLTPFLTLPCLIVVVRFVNVSVSASKAKVVGDRAIFLVVCSVRMSVKPLNIHALWMTNFFRRVCSFWRKNSRLLSVAYISIVTMIIYDS